MTFANAFFLTVFNFFLTVLNFFSVTVVANYDTSTLKLIHVVVRHGNRTVASDATYPTDPYINETFYPFGYGELTNEGKIKSYEVGRALRERYDSFLGDLYLPESLDAVTTNYNRTKMTLELLLAGLYPPAGTLLEWNPKLNWQPIPYSTVPPSDLLFRFPMYNCPQYIKLRSQLLKSPVGIAIQQRYEKLYKYLSINTGLHITDLHEVLVLYTTLVAEDDWGFKLPAWTNTVYPTILDKASGDSYVLATFTNQLRQLSGGYLLKKMLEDSKAKLNHTLVPKGRKLFIYSCHDVNLAYILGAMGVLTPHEPPYSAYLLVEIHTIQNIDGVMIFYQDYTGSELKQLVIPGCKKFCPLTKFVDLLRGNIPTNETTCNTRI